ncbi:hypothetical protein [Nocardia sp. NBC_01327]|uniref:hypothetical protein n=1 Tax=Nocardia sp. NBC_01327 TaxID=2903593 RepID=UPI002E10CF52|nr:hypothetical protein OG326_26055 [Nocardia sp. NBC_01327]
MSDNASRLARLRQALWRGTDILGSDGSSASGDDSSVPVVEPTSSGSGGEPATLRMPSTKVCARLPAWVFTLTGSEMQKMLDYSGPIGSPFPGAAVRHPYPVADAIPPALTIGDYLAHQQRALAIRLVMDSPEDTKPRTVLEFVQRCDADELRAVWAGTLGADALIATATAGPLPVLALLAAEVLDRAHRWHDITELERAAGSAGYRATQLFREYVHADEIDANRAAWWQGRPQRRQAV